MNQKQQKQKSNQAEQMTWQEWTENQAFIKTESNWQKDPGDHDEPETGVTDEVSKPYQVP